ncbi:ATP-dependent DNA helicase pif1-like [Parasteatoda tepidariorum]|uniref:ATP-dependent DNA helicase pif1-like n=1 Tax=Parasteatoda tepidariorum TaxID=114398 RepID=UPI001C72695D|nr:ATP-dependent DNA helicase pif1-like [Parasteatoda tepidariorum]
MKLKNFFLDGPAGTGKTFIYSTLLHLIRGKGHTVTPVASTGIATTLLKGGRTAHSIFKIPIILNATSTCNLKPTSPEAIPLFNSKLIIWNEAPMTHVHAFLAEDRLLQDIMSCSHPFGGKVVLIGGDFRQVLPVIPKGYRSPTIASCLKKHPLWTKFNILYLNQNMRALSTEKAFAEWLLDVGNCKDGEMIKLPDICYPSNQDPIKQLYSDVDFNTVTPGQLKGRAILTVTNDLSIVFNNDVLELLPGITKMYESVDTVISDDPQDQLSYPEEFLNTITPTGMRPTN